MSWLRRNKNPYGDASNDYLAASDTVGRPLAILFVILLVFVIGAVVFSLFLGGRWLYKNLDGKSTSTTTVITEQPATDSSAPATSQTNDTSAPAGSSTTAGGGMTSQPATSTAGGTSTATSGPATPQATPTMLPNTGPEPE